MEVAGQTGNQPVASVCTKPLTFRRLPQYRAWAFRGLTYRLLRSYPVPGTAQSPLMLLDCILAVSV